VRPAQHYTMGGVRTKPTGESATLKGLFAAGEAACWDMHGFNRLGRQLVAETVVAGMIVGEFVADFCDDARQRRQHSHRAGARVRRRRAGQARCDGAWRRHRERDALQGGDAADHDRQGRHLREGAKLEQAVSELQALVRRKPQASRRSAGPGPNPQLVTAYRTQKMLKLALTIAYRRVHPAPRAAARTSARTPAPQRRRVAEARTLATWKSEGDDLPTLAYEPIDVTRMGAAAGLARLWREGLHRPSRHAGPVPRPSPSSANPCREATASRAGGADAVPAPAPRALPRTQRAHPDEPFGTRTQAA